MDNQETDRIDVYPATHWSRIYLARDRDKTLGREALGGLLKDYRQALVAHLIWRFRVKPEQAEDWFQSFVERKILEYELLVHADQKRGRFRTFLLTSLDRFVNDELSREGAAKRRPQGGMVSLDEMEGEEHPGTSPTGADPGDVAWAREVVARAVRQTQRWYESSRNLQAWQVFYLARLEPMLHDKDRPSDRELADACGLPEAKVSNTINNAARKFKTELHRIILEYAESEDEVAAELQNLLDILAAAH